MPYNRAPNAPFHHLLHFHMDREMLEVGVYRLLFFLGRDLMLLSLVFYMYNNLGYQLWQICAFFLVWQMAHVLVIPFIGFVIERLGIKHALGLRCICASYYFVAILYFLTPDFYSSLLFLIPFFFLNAFGNNTALMGYDLFLSHHINKKNRGTAMAFFQIVIMAGALIAPILGGFITKYFGFHFTTLFGLGAMMGGWIVLMLTPDERFKLPYTPKKLIKDVFKKTPQNLVLGETGRVFFDAVIFLAWPLFLVLVLKDIASMGMVVGVSSFAAMILSFWIGKKIDSGKKAPGHILKSAALRSTVINLVRGVSMDPITLTIIDSLNKVNNQTVKVPYFVILYKWINYENQVERSHMRQVVFHHAYLLAFFLLFVVFYLAPQADRVVFTIIFVAAALMLLLSSRITGLEKLCVVKPHKKSLKRKSH